MSKTLSLVAMLAVASLSPATAFVTPSHSKAKMISPMKPSLSGPSIHKSQPQQLSQASSTTSLQMGFQLPPSPEPKGPFDEIKSILPTIATGALVILFFASPLGGLFFALFNSLFVLALVTPVLLFAGFQIWTALYTIEAPCPSCGAVPVRALKTGEPTVCLNCGAYSRANEKGDGVELCNNPNDMMNGQGGGLFDALFGGGGQPAQGDAGGFSSAPDFGEVFAGNSGAKKDGGAEEQAQKAKRQGTIIDVDVERD